jgi:ATP-dependent Clp protease protease subunit
MFYKDLSSEEFRKYAVKGQNISGSAVDGYIHRVENMTRAVIEERPMNFREVDVFSRLMADRIIFLGLGIDDNIANIVIAQLLFLESADPKKDILLYINSPGGSVYAGLGIYDTMQYIRPDVATINVSIAASMAAVLLAGGAKGKRSSLRHARTMIHQPSGAAGGQASDIQITVKQLVTLRDELYTIIASHTGKTHDQVKEDSDRDYWLTSKEALDYGLIDEILMREEKEATLK